GIEQAAGQQVAAAAEDRLGPHHNSEQFAQRAYAEEFRQDQPRRHCYAAITQPEQRAKEPHIRFIEPQYEQRACKHHQAADQVHSGFLETVAQKSEEKLPHQAEEKQSAVSPRGRRRAETDLRRLQVQYELLRDRKDDEITER